MKGVEKTNSTYLFVEKIIKIELGSWIDSCQLHRQKLQRSICNMMVNFSARKIVKNVMNTMDLGQQICFGCRALTSI